MTAPAVVAAAAGVGVAKFSQRTHNFRPPYFRWGCLARGLRALSVFFSFYFFVLMLGQRAPGSFPLLLFHLLERIKQMHIVPLGYYPLAAASAALCVT